jgi:hypothetical protein
MLEKLHSEGFGKNTELIEWGRGVDLQLFDPARRSDVFRASRGISTSDVVILWVGRLVPEKRPDIWMSIMQRLQAEGINVKALVVGHGAYESALSEIQNVHCCGWLSGTHLAEAYASADILLFPSDVETFGNVTLEALASGCVCIVESGCGGHLVEHNHNGMTCTAGNEEEFYNATRKLVVDHDLRREMSKHARQSAWKFERTKILQQMAEHYKDAIVRHKDPNFMIQRLKSSPEAAGKNILSFLCCNFWLIKNFAEPVLNTTSSVQNVALSTTECVNNSRHRCSERFTCTRNTNKGNNMESKDVRYEDERKGKRTSAQLVFLMKALSNTATLFSYIIIGLLIYVSFTV